MTSRASRSALATTAAVTLCGLLALASGPSAQAPTPAETAALYKAKCAACHLANGASKTASMNFTDNVWQHGSSSKEIAEVIRNGVKGTAMMPFKGKLSDDQVVALAKYVRAFDKSLKD